MLSRVFQHGIDAAISFRPNMKPDSYIKLATIQYMKIGAAMTSWEHCAFQQQAYFAHTS